MGKALQIILKLLSRCWAGIVALLGSINWGGMAISTTVAVAYVAIWAAALVVAFPFMVNALNNLSGNMLDVGAPAIVWWGLRQVFPIQLSFALVGSLIVLRLSAGLLTVIAVAASRRLMGK